MEPYLRKLMIHYRQHKVVWVKMNKWHKGIAKWEVGDTLYLSVPFTWLIDEANDIASQYKGTVLMGGACSKKTNSLRRI